MNIVPKHFTKKISNIAQNCFYFNKIGV